MSLEQLHHQVRQTPGRHIEIKNADGIGMIDPTRRDSLETETLETLYSLSPDRRAEDFDRDGMVQQNVLTAIHGAESPGSDLGANPILVVENMTGQRLGERGEDLLGAPGGSHIFGARFGEQLIFQDQF